EDRVVIGTGIAQKLSMGISGYGDVLQLLVPKSGKGIITNFNQAFNAVNTIVVGIYSINEDLNDKYVFAPFGLAKQLLNLKKNEVSLIEIKLKPGVEEEDVKPQIQKIFGANVAVKNRIQLNDELYKMLNTENLAVYLIFTLVLIIALFNVGGAIVMAILDKRENIVTLSNMGTPPKNIRRIFLLQGSLLTFVSGAAGLILGIILVLVQEKIGFVMITQDLPYPVS